MNDHPVQDARTESRVQILQGFYMNEQKKDDLTDDEVMDLEIGMGPF